MGAFAEAAAQAGQVEVWQLTATGEDVELVQHCEDGGHAARVLRSVCERAAVSVRAGLVLAVKGGVSSGVLKRLRRLVDRKRRALGLPIDGEQAPAPDAIPADVDADAPRATVPTVEVPANDTTAPDDVVLPCPVCGSPSARANSRTPAAFVSLCRPCRADAFLVRRSDNRANASESPEAVVAFLVRRARACASPGAPDDAPAVEPEVTSQAALGDAPVEPPAPELAADVVAEGAPVAVDAPASPGAPDDATGRARERGGCRWPEGCRGPAFASGYCGPHTHAARRRGLLPPKAPTASGQVHALVAHAVVAPVVTAPSPEAPVAIVVTPRSEGEALQSVLGELRTLVARLGGWDKARALAARVERAGGADELLALLDDLEAR